MATPPSSSRPGGASAGSTGSKLRTRKLRAGETLLKPGDKAKHVYVVQSGRLSLCQAKNGQCIEIAQVPPGQCLGDEAVFGSHTWASTALAVRESVVVEVPVEALAEPMSRLSPMFRLMLKALSERAKATLGEVRTLRLGRDQLPCPPDHVAKVFAVLFHVVRMRGELDAEGASGVADWDDVKAFATEVFGESEPRLEDAAAILMKQGCARFEGKRLQLTDLRRLEEFFDYYGGYHFKSGYGELLKTNAKMQKLVEEVLALAGQYPMDRGGQVRMPYKPTVDALKQRLGSGFEADQLFRLEQKGLFIKRISTPDGGILAFLRVDFEQVLMHWKILREVELWNEKGFVDAADAPVPEKGHPPSEARSEVFDFATERSKWAKTLESWKPATAAGAEVPKVRRGDKAQNEIWCSVCMSVLDRELTRCPTCGAELSKKPA